MSGGSCMGLRMHGKCYKVVSIALRIISTIHDVVVRMTYWSLPPLEPVSSCSMSRAIDASVEEYVDGPCSGVAFGKICL